MVVGNLDILIRTMEWSMNEKDTQLLDETTWLYCAVRMYTALNPNTLNIHMKFKIEIVSFFKYFTETCITFTYFFFKLFLRRVWSRVDKFW